MATADNITHQSFAKRVDDISRRLICSNAHDALRALIGISNAIHPVFCELEDKEKDALMMGVAPLAEFAHKEIQSILIDLEQLSEAMKASEVSHEH